MFNRDVSYLYSDEWQMSSTSNEKPLSEKVSTYQSSRSSSTTRLHLKLSGISSHHHRSKHILICREDLIQSNNDRREKYRMATRRFKERRHLFEENLLKTLKFYAEERLELENNLKQCETSKQKLQAKILEELYGSSSMEHDKSPSLTDQQTFTFSSNNYPPVK